MEEKIAGWRKQISGYQKDIEKTESMLQKLGFSVEEEILKTPEQIAQEQKDSRLKQKIELANKGSKVEFSKEERDRINQLQKAQKEAREKMQKIAGMKNPFPPRRPILMLSTARRQKLIRRTGRN